MLLPMCLFVYLSLSSLFRAVVSVCFGLFSPQIMLISPILYLFKTKAAKVSCPCIPFRNTYNEFAP